LRSTMIKKEEERLYKAAQTARQNAYTPYSRFPVGAALLTQDGKIYAGSNVENASYGLSVCAERVAVWKAVSEGERAFSALLLAIPHGTPCGACRQVLAEFCAPEMPIVIYEDGGNRREFALRDLLPEAFTPDNLEL